MRQYKDIIGYEGHYQVSDNGNIKSIKKLNKNEEGLLLSQKVDSDGYCEVGLWKDGKVKYKKVHRLVAVTYIDNPENKPQINHIDANKRNNNVSNLEWATPQEDADHREANNLTPKKERHYAWSKFGKESKSAKIVLNTQTGIFYDCVADAANSCGIKYKTLTGMLSGNDKNRTNFIYA